MTISNVILRMVGTNNCGHPKYAKSCCPKTTWAIILMSPSHLLEATGVLSAVRAGSTFFRFKTSVCMVF